MTKRIRKPKKPRKPGPWYTFIPRFWCIEKLVPGTYWPTIMAVYLPYDFHRRYIDYSYVVLPQAKEDNNERV